MGHNVSTRKRTSQIMSAPLADWAGWRLEVDCGGQGCPRGRKYDIRQLSGMYRGLSVSDALRRMRCSQCGYNASTAVMRPGPEIRVRHEGIALIGPGSY